MDNVTDSELPAQWQGSATDEILITSATMLSALPSLALARLRVDHDGAAHRVHALHARLAQGLLRMAGGQLADISPALRGRLIPSVEASVTAKSGDEISMFAALAATLATRRRAVVSSFEEAGQAMGIAGQLSSDCYDIWRRQPSHDLLNGRRTLPVAYALDATRGVQRARLRSILDAARMDPGCHPAARQELVRLGALTYVSLKVEMQVSRARKALDRTGFDGAAVAELKERVGALSMIRRREP